MKMTVLPDINDLLRNALARFCAYRHVWPLFVDSSAQHFIKERTGRIESSRGEIERETKRCKTTANRYATSTRSTVTSTGSRFQATLYANLTKIQSLMTR